MISFRAFARRFSTLRKLHEELALVLLLAQRYLDSISRGASLRRITLDGRELTAASNLVSKLSNLAQSRRMFRIGREFDGGYFFPSGVGPFDAVFSPGTGGVVDFDLYFANQGIPVFQLDGSVDGPPVNHENFHFAKKFLDSKYGLEEWVRATPFRNSKDLVLQMDIEGHEWEVLNRSSDKLIRQFAVIVLELHGFDEVFTQMGDQKLTVLKRILDSHSPALFSANNFARSTRIAGMQVPPVVEVVLIRKDKIPSASLRDAQLVAPLKNHPRLPNSNLVLRTGSKLLKVSRSGSKL